MISDEQIKAAVKLRNRVERESLDSHSLLNDHAIDAVTAALLQVEARRPRAKITAIYGGGDWADASVDHLVVPDDVSVDEQKKEWWNWYNTAYCPAVRSGENPKYVGLVEWLVKLGARKPTEDELEESGDNC